MNFKEILKEKQVDAFYLTNDYNKRYLTNFSGSTSEVIIYPDKIQLITDGRYKTQVKNELYKEIEVVILETGVTYNETLNQELNKHNVKRLLVESEAITLDKATELQKNYEIVAQKQLIEAKRLIKTDQEVDKIKKAVAITDKAFSYIVQEIKVGMTEVEVKSLLEKKQLELGASGTSFDTIVAFGENAAKPHAQAGTKKLESGEIVTIDFGCYYQGYCSDMTRTFFVGENANQELLKIHDIVHEAMELQIKSIKAGIKINEIDKIGRDYITKAGYGEFFMHGTGHGIGLEVHEAPIVGSKNQEELQAGMVITIEPGIYLENLGGCRLENDILVLENGYEVLNKSEIKKYYQKGIE